MFLFIWILTSNIAYADVINSELINDFEDGSTHGWKKGAGEKNPDLLPKVVNESTGNQYLEVIAIGGGTTGKVSSSQMSFINETEWRGNYHVAEVGSVQVSMKNMGTEPLYMRLGFTTRAIEEWHFAGSHTPLVLPADGQWYDLSFAITEDEITPFLGNEGECCFPEWDFNEVIAGINQLKFFSGKTAHFWNGDRVTSTLGVDDVRVISETKQGIEPSSKAAGEVVSAAPVAASN